MKYDFYFSQTQKDNEMLLETSADTFNAFIKGDEYTECIEHGKDITENTNIKDYVFICTADDSEITFKQ